MFVKYIGKLPTLVRSLGVKVEVKKGDVVEVNEKELISLKNSYKRLFDFEVSKKETKVEEEKETKEKTLIVKK